MEGGKRRFPPSLNAVRSEYKRFCEEYGGPIICDDSFANIDFEHCCREFPRRRFAPIIDRWVTDPDPNHGIRHWPVMAFAASQYAFRLREFKKYGSGPSPNEKVRPSPFHVALTSSPAEILPKVTGRIATVNLAAPPSGAYAGCWHSPATHVCPHPRRVLEGKRTIL